jgi:predicted RNA-binding protein with PUA-like domain
MRHWLVKSEPDAYSLDDLARDRRTEWDGVRNYQARNFMRDEMRVGDLVLFHHSGADPAGIAGVAKVVRAGHPDHTAWTVGHPHHDPKSTPDEPIWAMVDLAFVERFPSLVPLAALRADPALAGMALLQRGQRLSVLPVEALHFKRVLALGRRGAPSAHGAGVDAALRGKAATARSTGARSPRPKTS